MLNLDPDSEILEKLRSFLRNIVNYIEVIILLLLIAIGLPLGLLALFHYLGWVSFTLGRAIGFVVIWLAILGIIGVLLFWLINQLTKDQSLFEILASLLTTMSSVEMRVPILVIVSSGLKSLYDHLKKSIEDRSSEDESSIVLGERLYSLLNKPRIVRIGIVETDPPETATADEDVLPNTQSLIQDKTYYLRIDISTKLNGSNVSDPVAISPEVLERIPLDIPLEVIVFSEDFELIHTGPYRSRQPLRLRWDKTSTFIFIRLTAPKQPGLARLRTAIFFRNALLQWLETTARVTSTEGQEDALSQLVSIVPFLALLANLNIKTISQMAVLSEDQIKTLAQQLGLPLEKVGSWQQEADWFAHLGNETRVIYTISPTLEDFEVLESPTASILFDSTKGRVQVKGSQQSPPPANLSTDLNSQLLVFRKMMATINRPEGGIYPFQPDNKGDPEKLPVHLLEMADLGRTLYNVIFLNTRMREYLRAELNQAGLIEIALASSQNVVPWGALYDLPLAEDFKAKIMGVERQVCMLWAEKSHQQQVDPENGPSKWKLDYKTCIAAKDCPRQRRENESEADYKARVELMVCIYGFWGFKHRLQLPPGIREISDDQDNNRPEKESDEVTLPSFIPVTDEPKVGIIVNKNIRPYSEHLQNLSMFQNRPLKPEIKWADTLKATEAILTDKTLHLVYFYCHGKIVNGLPSLIVGNNDIPLTVNTFSNTWWPNAPLVFINGCETVTYSPEAFTDLVLQFRGLNASGVIGTEIEVFPMLARWFGDEFIKRFLAGEPVGQIMLDLRLELLKKYNPLGLIYTNYSLAGLQLLDEASINVYRRRAMRRVNPSP